MQKTTFRHPKRMCFDFFLYLCLRIFIYPNNITFMLRYKKKLQVAEIAITAVSAMLSVGVMIYAVALFGWQEAGEEIILNMFYIACIVMMWMYLFNRLSTQRFNYWSSICVCITILLRDILFPPPLATYALHLACLTLSVWLVMMLTYFYARKEWKSYTKNNLWFIFIVDVAIAALYNYDIMIEDTGELKTFLLTEIWIRPTLTYGLVACFMREDNNNE